MWIVPNCLMTTNQVLNRCGILSSNLSVLKLLNEDERSVFAHRSQEAVITSGKDL